MNSEALYVLLRCLGQNVTYEQVRTATPDERKLVWAHVSRKFLEANYGTNN